MQSHSIAARFNSTASLRSAIATNCVALPLHHLALPLLRGLLVTMLFHCRACPGEAQLFLSLSMHVSASLSHSVALRFNSLACLRESKHHGATLFLRGLLVTMLFLCFAYQSCSFALRFNSIAWIIYAVQCLAIALML